MQAPGLPYTVAGSSYYVLNFLFFPFLSRINLYGDFCGNSLWPSQSEITDSGAKEAACVTAELLMLVCNFYIELWARCIPGAVTCSIFPKEENLPWWAMIMAIKSLPFVMDVAASLLDATLVRSSLKYSKKLSKEVSVVYEILSMP